MTNKLKISSKLITALALLALLTVPGGALAGALEAEIERYKREFTAVSSSNARTLVDSLTWKGIDSPALYDIIEDKLRRNYLTNDGDTVEVNSWLVKALAFSGDRSRADIMREIAGSKASKKLRKHNDKAVLRLPSYVAWNPVISAGTAQAADPDELAQIRIANMVGSDYSELIRAGAKQVFHKHAGDFQLQDAVEAALLAQIDSTRDDSSFLDAMAWLCKSLAESGNPKYKSTLRQVQQSGMHKKVRKYARKYAGNL